MEGVGEGEKTREKEGDRWKISTKKDADRRRKDRKRTAAEQAAGNQEKSHGGRRTGRRRFSKDGTMEAKTETSLTGSRLPTRESSTWPRSRGNRELESLGYLVCRLREYLSASTSDSFPSFLLLPRESLRSSFSSPLPPSLLSLHPPLATRPRPLLPRLGPSLIPPLFFHTSQLSSRGGTPSRCYHLYPWSVAHRYAESRFTQIHRERLRIPKLVPLALPLKPWRIVGPVEAGISRGYRPLWSFDLAKGPAGSSLPCRNPLGFDSFHVIIRAPFPFLLPPITRVSPSVTPEHLRPSADLLHRTDSFVQIVKDSSSESHTYARIHTRVRAPRWRPEEDDEDEDGTN